MSTHFAVFGKTPALSAAELLAVFDREGTKLKVQRLAAAGVIFETQYQTLVNKTFWSQFGGMVKAGEILFSNSRELEPGRVQKTIGEDTRERIPVGRIKFGVSEYRLEAVNEGQSAVGVTLKKSLAAGGRSVRHVTSRDPQLSAVTVRKNKLLGPGVEYCIFVDQKQIAVGVTQWVQDYEEFALREFARPAADAVSGMLPVKLARMLINLAAVPRTATLLDPFCGSGTLLTEALALGQEKIIGSDLEASAVKQTMENLDWFNKRFSPRGQATIIQSAAEEIDRRLAGQKINAVVTEPYLGPPLRGGEKMTELQRRMDELSAIYTATFRALSRLLTSGAPVVFVLPVYIKGSQTILCPAVPEIIRAGFRPDPLLPERWSHTPGLELTSRGGLLYSRPGQNVLREILRLRAR